MLLIALIISYHRIIFKLLENLYSITYLSNKNSSSLFESKVEYTGVYGLVCRSGSFFILVELVLTNLELFVVELLKINRNFNLIFKTIKTYIYL